MLIISLSRFGSSGRLQIWEFYLLGTFCILLERWVILEIFCLRLDFIKNKFVAVAWWHRGRGGSVVLRDDFTHFWPLSLKDGRYKERSEEDQGERLDLYVIFPYKPEY